MKNNKLYVVFALTVAFFCGCKKYENGNYPGAKVSPYIAIYDLRSLYKETTIDLSEQVLAGSESITGVVTSDHSGNNIPAGLLVLQDSRRLSQLRGISVDIGTDAAKYVPGDSVIVKIARGKLQRVDGLLEVTGINGASVTKVASGKRVVTPVIGSVGAITANPDLYESTVVTITKTEFNPPATNGETYAGNKKINNGSGDFTLHTEADASFASVKLPFSATYTGILFVNKDGFSLWPRTANDLIVLSDKPPVISPVLITGFMADPIQTDTNYEYVQFLATRDIDFAVTPMSVVFNNNAGATTPLGVPTMGWATGGTVLNGSTKTYKLNMTSGKVTKGSYFYVGGIKAICGAGSTDISNANWIANRLYSVTENNVGFGDDFGVPTTNILANSGNVAGIAVFATTTVDSSSVPVDVIMYGGGGTVFSAGPPPVGYKICNTDYYETENTAVSTLDPQAFYSQGTNTFKFGFPTVANNTTKTGYFAQLGGTYNNKSGKWLVKRTMTSVMVTPTSSLSQIEGGTTLNEEQ